MELCLPFITSMETEKTISEQIDARLDGLAKIVRSPLFEFHVDALRRDIADMISGVVDEETGSRWQKRLSAFEVEKYLILAEKEFEALMTTERVDNEMTELDMARKSLDFAEQAGADPERVEQLRERMEKSIPDIFAKNIEKYINLLKNGQYFIYSANPIKDLKEMISNACAYGVQKEKLAAFEKDRKSLSAFVALAIAERWVAVLKQCYAKDKKRPGKQLENIFYTIEENLDIASGRDDLAGKAGQIGDDFDKIKPEVLEVYLEKNIREPNGDGGVYYMKREREAQKQRVDFARKYGLNEEKIKEITIRFKESQKKNWKIAIPHELKSITERPIKPITRDIDYRYYIATRALKEAQDDGLEEESLRLLKKQIETRFRSLAVCDAEQMIACMKMYEKTEPQRHIVLKIFKRIIMAGHNGADENEILALETDFSTIDHGILMDFIKNSLVVLEKLLSMPLKDEYTDGENDDVNPWVYIEELELAFGPLPETLENTEKNEDLQELWRRFENQQEKLRKLFGK